MQCFYLIIFLKMNWSYLRVAIINRSNSAVVVLLVPNESNCSHIFKTFWRFQVQSSEPVCKTSTVNIWLFFDYLTVSFDQDFWSSEIRFLTFLLMLVSFSTLKNFAHYKRLQIIWNYSDSSDLAGWLLWFVKEIRHFLIILKWQ